MTDHHDLGAGAPSIPVTILTGFLGAGKTTLLNRILNGDHGMRVAVLVNDFGSVNIDAELVVGVESGGDVISLANGCVCCNIRNDLLAAVQQVLERPDRPECIVLEASGVAEPSGVALTFLDECLRDRIRLDSILCVVDASQVFAVPETMELKLRQIAFADMLILNKADLVGREEVGRIQAWLDEWFSRYRLIEATRGDVPLDILLGSGRFDPSQLEEGERRHAVEHATAFGTWSYETDQLVSLEALKQAAARLPADIYRCKGVIRTAEAPERRAILQVVGKRVDISLADAWAGRPARTRIVTIGAPGAMDRETLQTTFDSCIVPPG